MIDEDFAAEMADVTWDLARDGVGLEEWPPALPAPRRSPTMEMARPSPFLSVADLAARWGCGRTFTYGAISEMDAAGYLQRVWLGRVQRVSVDSVEKWEALHSKADVDTDRSTIATLRTAAPARPMALPRPRRHAAHHRAPAPARSKGIVEAWRALSKRAA